MDRCVASGVACAFPQGERNTCHRNRSSKKVLVGKKSTSTFPLQPSKHVHTIVCSSANRPWRAARCPSDTHHWSHRRPLVSPSNAPLRGPGNAPLLFPGEAGFGAPLPGSANAPLCRRRGDRTELSVGFTNWASAFLVPSGAFSTSFRFARALPRWREGRREGRRTCGKDAWIRARRRNDPEGQKGGWRDERHERREHDR